MKLALRLLPLALVIGCGESKIDRIAQLQEILTSPSADSAMVVAHRGCWKDAPENSVAAIEGCIQLGVEMVELDVRRTADGVLFLMHDETVDRTTNGSGRVDEFTYSELRELRLREGAGGLEAVVTKEEVPTFRDAMLAAKDNTKLLERPVRSSTRRSISGRDARAGCEHSDAPD